MSEKPDVEFVERRTLETHGGDMTSRFWGIEGSVFRVAVDETKMPPIDEREAAYKRRIAADDDLLVLVSVGVVDYECFAQAVDGEEWSAWLDEQRDEHDGGGWEIANIDKCYLGPHIWDDHRCVMIVIDNEQTAQAFAKRYEAKMPVTH